MDGLTRELEARHGSAQQILGDGHPLTQFIRNALESGDPKLLQVAKAACDGGHGMLHPWTNLPEPPREELVEEYARKPVRCFLQVDGWEDKNGGGSAMRPDEEGHVLTSGTRYELRNTDFPMRVQIYEASDKETVLALLGKAQTWLERGWEGLTTPPPPRAPDKQRSEEERTPIRAAERRVGVVVENDPRRAPGDEHGLAGAEHEGHQRLERAGPALRRPERRRRPVERPHERPCLPAMLQEGGRRVGFPWGVRGQARAHSPPYLSAGTRAHNAQTRQDRSPARRYGRCRHAMVGGRPPPRAARRLGRRPAGPSVGQPFRRAGRPRGRRSRPATVSSGGASRR